MVSKSSKKRKRTRGAGRYIIVTMNEEDGRGPARTQRARPLYPCAAAANLRLPCYETGELSMRGDISVVDRQTYRARHKKTTATAIERSERFFRRREGGGCGKPSRAIVTTIFLSLHHNVASDQQSGRGHWLRTHDFSKHPMVPSRCCFW